MLRKLSQGITEVREYLDKVEKLINTDEVYKSIAEETVKRLVYGIW